MSEFHVLEQDGYRLRVIHHFAAPGGNNTVGQTWKSVLLASGAAGFTRLSEGAGPGQISTLERTQVLAGDVMEIEVLVDLARNLTAAQTVAAVTAQATQQRTEFLQEQQARLRLYGGTA